MMLLLALLLFLLVAGFAWFLQRERLARRGLEGRVKDLNRQLQDVFGRLEEERSRLETTFSGMAEGVLLTNGQGDIAYLNPAFREMFRLKEGVEGRSALEVLASVACDDAIRAVIREGKTVEREVTFERPTRRIFQVYFSPVRREGKLTGVVSVFHDLTAIRRLEEVRRDFIANLSHELKTPLTAIRGYAETLLEECGGDPAGRPSSPESRKSLEVIFRRASEMSHLTENLLNLSRIESGKEDLSLESVALRPFVASLLERFSAQARVKRIELASEIPESAPPLSADPHKLNQILSNLVDNAVKYTQEGGRIWVRASAPSLPSPLKGERVGVRGNNEVQIEVEDNGPGIPLEDRERIFERFYRVDKARSRGTGGAGLGLAIVKHLVELHGGRVEVQSEVGRGSSFQIFLPSEKIVRQAV